MSSTTTIETERLRLRPVAKEDLDEVLRAVLDWAFERFDLPHSTTMIRPDNAPSLAVAERSGLSPVREDELLGVPVIVHAVRPEEWVGSA